MMFFERILQVCCFVSISKIKMCLRKCDFLRDPVNDFPDKLTPATVIRANNGSIELLQKPEGVVKHKISHDLFG